MSRYGSGALVQVTKRFAAATEARVRHDAEAAFNLSHTNVVNTLSHEIKPLPAPSADVAAFKLQIVQVLALAPVAVCAVLCADKMPAAAAAPRAERLHAAAPSQELCAGGSLANFLRYGHARSAESGLLFDRVLMVLRDVAAGMAFVHGRQVGARLCRCLGRGGVIERLDSSAGFGHCSRRPAQRRQQRLYMRTMQSASAKLHGGYAAAARAEVLVAMQLTAASAPARFCCKLRTACGPTSARTTRRRPRAWRRRRWIASSASPRSPTLASACTSAKAS